MVVKHKGGRPRKPQAIRRMVNFRVEDETFDRMAAAAERAGLPLSAWLRAAALAALEREGE